MDSKYRRIYWRRMRRMDEKSGRMYWMSRMRNKEGVLDEKDG